MFRLNGPIGPDYDHDLDDVTKTKAALAQLGHFKAPKYGATAYPDRPLFDGIKKFQKAHGLKVDGVMKPDGPTARVLGNEFVEDRLQREPRRPERIPKPWPERDREPDIPEGSLVIKPLFGTGAEVGWGRRNAPRDVLATRRALAWAGHLPKPADAEKTSADETLFKAIHAFQSAAGVKSDGWLGRGGETAKALDAAIAPKVRAHQAAATKTDPSSAADQKDPRTQVAMAPFAAPLVAPAAQALLRLLPGLAAGIAGKQAADEAIKPSEGTGDPKRTDMAAPPPPTPPSEEREPVGPSKTELPSRPPFKEMDLSNPIPENMDPGIYVHPLPPEELKNGTIIERKGNEETRKELERIRDHYESLGWEHIAGGRYSANNAKIGMKGIKEGGEQKEYYIPGPGLGRQGAKYTDLTFIHPNGQIIHVQSVDVDRHGKPTQRELDAAWQIKRAEKNTQVLLIAKGAQLNRRKSIKKKKARPVKGRKPAKARKPSVVRRRKVGKRKTQRRGSIGHNWNAVHGKKKK